MGYPAGCSINITVPGVEARYVRVLADSMWSRDDWYVFGLSELQVYGSNRNLALGKPVYAKDETDKPAEAGWAPAHLVDGYTSRYRLIEWPEYLRLMDKRGRLEKERAALEHRRADKLSLGTKILGGTVVSLVVLVVAAWIWGMVRHRVLRRREAEQLRQQIARDLHDDIGSNLGGIVLLSEIGSEHCPDEESRSDFEAIRKAAEDASLSMRDIVWLIQREPVGTEGLRDADAAVVEGDPESSGRVVGGRARGCSGTGRWACCSGGMCFWPSRRCSTTCASTRRPAGSR